jgi:hypothetical protein
MTWTRKAQIFNICVVSSRGHCLVEIKQKLRYSTILKGNYYAHVTLRVGMLGYNNYNPLIKFFVSVCSNL